jgi:hypothetical protein
MPTAYTSPVGDGTLVDFRDFALRCAHAFAGPRGASLDSPLPSEPVLDDCYQRAVTAAREAFDRMRRMTLAECIEAQQNEIATERAFYEERTAKQSACMAGYHSMLEKVRAWSPPTGSHARLKTFMIEQLQLSLGDEIAFVLPRPASPEVWHGRKLEQCRTALWYAQKRLEEEQIKAQKTTAWLRALKESL